MFGRKTTWQEVLVADLNRAGIRYAWRNELSPELSISVLTCNHYDCTYTGMGPDCYTLMRVTFASFEAMQGFVKRLPKRGGEKAVWKAVSEFKLTAA